MVTARLDSVDGSSSRVNQSQQTPLNMHVWKYILVKKEKLQQTDSHLKLFITYPQSRFCCSSSSDH